MSTRWNLTSRLAVTSLMTLAGIAFATNARGAKLGCLPPTPSPCSADGTCRPNQASFGYSQTRWRPWPGDPQPEKPTLVEDPTTEDEMRLAPFLPPTPEKEDVRGPTKTKSFTPPEEDSPEALPDPLSDQDQDPQGSIPALLRQEDAPPELPRKLRRYVSASRLGHLSKTLSASTGRLQAASAERPLRGYERRTRSGIENHAATGAGPENQQAIYHQPLDRTGSKRAK